MEPEAIEKIKKAGEIHKQVITFAKELAKPGTKLLEIANQVDAKITEFGAKPAFPINLSIDEIAAHATPAWNDEEVARGLLKIDIGIHIDGYVADGAISLDLEDSDENKQIIAAAEAGLAAAIQTCSLQTTLGDIGKEVHSTIAQKGLLPIKNLTGHQIEQYNLHAGVSIPNYDSGQTHQLEEGLYAIEPFATNGAGRVRDGKPSGIYKIMKATGTVRDNFAREVLQYIDEEYQGLPFCSRWIHKKYGSRGLLALRQIQQAGIIHQYPQLVEKAGGKVAQAEHTVLLLENQEKIITTKQ